MPITQIEKMPMLRVFFAKTGRAKYTSHLDTMRMFTRALRRSGLPLWYTQGFNPHLYMTFALPLPLGTEGLCESVDLRLTEELPFEEAARRIDAALPPGFVVKAAAAPVHKPDDIAWADYTLTLPCDTPAESTAALARFFEQPAIEVMKRTKKGEKQVDIKPLTELLSCETTAGGLLLQLRCAAGIHTNIAPTLLLDAFAAFANQPLAGGRIVRCSILTADLHPFV